MTNCLDPSVAPRAPESAERSVQLHPRRLEIRRSDSRPLASRIEKHHSVLMVRSGEVQLLNLPGNEVQGSVYPGLLR